MNIRNYVERNSMTIEEFAEKYGISINDATNVFAKTDDIIQQMESNAFKAYASFKNINDDLFFK